MKQSMKPVRAYPSDCPADESADSPSFDWLMPLAPWEDPEILSQTLESLKQQTWQARALVVSVDGRLGTLLEATLQASALPIEIHQSMHWEGTGPVLARGMLACKSEIVLRVDADDLSVPERSRWQVEQMLADPNLAVLGGQLEEIGWDGQLKNAQHLRQVPLNTESIEGLACWRNPMNHPTVALRRSKILDAGNYRTCPYFEDWDLWLRMLKRGMLLRNDPRVLVCARVGADHLSRRHGWRYLKNEYLFLLGALHSSLIPFPTVIVLFFTRLPLRLLPKQWLRTFMAVFLRRDG
ncbi:glycosyltransferase [Cyanobium sp. BA5m-10]|uniref:glycosyltransferase n=1 Tax=Cyanobium sp. BA5m-10 TaxID=2823705 RepID=UPI0020CE5669|nr:glycosyltransferase [Cyanobium sp. BA5m-10]MCP9904714.1 glycosyltransferase [Cyanobium sp. BA5m-10]